MVIKNMKDRIANNLVPKERKIFLFSGHENNVINVLAALNVFKPHVPNYSAAIYLELHYLPFRGKHAVRVSRGTIVFCLEKNSYLRNPGHVGFRF